MTKKNTRRGKTQTKQPMLNAGFLPPWRGKMSARTEEGVTDKSFFTPPLPAFGHPLPPGARKTTHGFTLIELLVVVLIIGILAAVAVPQYNKAVEKSRLSEARIVLSNIRKAYQLCALEYGAYATECGNGENGLLAHSHIDMPGTQVEDDNCEWDGGCFVTKDWAYDFDGTSVYAYRYTDIEDLEKFKASIQIVEVAVANGCIYCSEGCALLGVEEGCLN